MSIDISIILISYNKYPQNLLTLYSLQYQTFNLEKMEVILVDDASTDQTYILESVETPFHYKYIRCQQNVGRSKAKNIGIENASGKVLIFLDSEVIADPHFVEYHFRHHQNRDDIVVAGTQSHNGTYSTLYPEFSRGQIKHFYSIIQNNPTILNQLHLSSRSHTKNRTKLRRILQSEDSPIVLLSQEGIKNQDYKQLSFHFPSFPEEILTKYSEKLKGYHLAWTYFITRNVSVSKIAVENVGLFNEIFSGWGYEDWELGYRLYKQGVCFIEDTKIVTYHQEHPYSTENREKEQMQNYKNLAKLHPSIEVFAFSFSLLRSKDFLEINFIIDEYLRLCEKYPDQYNNFKSAFINMLKVNIDLLVSGKEVTNLVNAIGLQKEKDKKSNVFRELEGVKGLGEYSTLIEGFYMLVHL